VRIVEVVQAPTPNQARIKALQAQAAQSQQRVKSERVRQQQMRLNAQRAAINSANKTIANT
jgi:hypothetical protein